MIDIPTQPVNSATKPARRGSLEGAEKEKYVTVLAQMKELQGVAVSESDGTIAPLSNTEKMWLSSDCIQRYLRATKWDVDATVKRLKNTLVWRRTIGLGEGGKLTNDEYIREEQLTGKQLILGFDNQSRPLWYMKPDRQNTQESPRQTDHAYFMLECARLLCPQGVETVSLLINYAKKAKGPSLSTSKSVMYNLADHYPETLGTAFVINLPTVVTWMFKIISPLLDPVTREKLSFSNDVSHMVDKSQLENSFGGDLDLTEYDHDKYWSQLMSLVNARKEKLSTRWNELGASVGVSEWDMKAE